MSKAKLVFEDGLLNTDNNSHQLEEKYSATTFPLSVVGSTASPVFVSNAVRNAMFL